MRGRRGGRWWKARRRCGRRRIWKSKPTRSCPYASERSARGRSGGAEERTMALREDDGLGAVEQDPVLEVPAQPAGEDLALDVAADAAHLLG